MPVSEGTLEYLRDPALAALWDSVSARLERNDLEATGAVRVPFSPVGAAQLSGLLGRTVVSGTVTVKLAELDERLRGLEGSGGLLAVTEQVRGVKLTDKRKVRADRSQAAFELYRQWDDAIAEAGLTPAAAQSLGASVRSSGILTRAGGTASSGIARFASGWAELVKVGAFDAIGEPRLLLGELASKTTGTAHGFDEGTVASKLMMRALAARFDEPVPETGEDRRRLWMIAGVSTDSVSGTALMWGFRPPGDDPWSAMMRSRADLEVVTHLTLQELRVAAGVLLAPPGSTVFACENPQVLQAAAKAGASSAVLCLSGQGSAAAWLVLRRLIADGVTVAYHGDFDWPGVAIAGRAYLAGATPWRMSAADYVAAVVESAEQEPLEGRQTATPWETGLAGAMRTHNTAIHEEAVIDSLLRDVGVPV